MVERFNYVKPKKEAVKEVKKMNAKVIVEPTKNTIKSNTRKHIIFFHGQNKGSVIND